jgi:hypothetical protein
VKRAVYCVVERGGVWSVSLNDKQYGPCRSKEHALDVALRAAARAHRQDIEAHVVIREGAGFRTVWCGKEELPAKAA